MVEEVSADTEDKKSPQLRECVDWFVLFLLHDKCIFKVFGDVVLSIYVFI